MLAEYVEKKKDELDIYVNDIELWSVSYIV